MKASLQQKQAFNKYNPIDLLGQLVAVLEGEELAEAAQAVRQVSSVVNKAWTSRKEAKLAARAMGLR